MKMFVIRWIFYGIAFGLAGLACYLNARNDRRTVSYRHAMDCWKIACMFGVMTLGEMFFALIGGKS